MSTSIRTHYWFGFRWYFHMKKILNAKKFIHTIYILNRSFPAIFSLKLSIDSSTNHSHQFPFLVKTSHSKISSSLFRHKYKLRILSKSHYINKDFLPHFFFAEILHLLSISFLIKDGMKINRFSLDESSLKLFTDFSKKNFKIHFNS